MWRSARGAAACAVLVLLACDRSADRPVDATGRRIAGRSGGASDALERNTGWNAEAGGVLILPSLDGGAMAATIIRPEATDGQVGDTLGLAATLGDQQVDLFARSGLVGSAQLARDLPPQLRAGCTAWPVARLNASAVTPWTVAFPAGHVVAIPMDSLAAWPSADSLRVVTTLSQLAAALPDDTLSSFRGLRYVVRQAWRSRGEASGFLVAILARRLNQEDAPREERIVLVVEQPGEDPARWTVGWHERASGLEESLVVAEPALAYRAGRGREVQLLFGRDDGRSLSAALLIRTDTGWQVAWESAQAGCD
ncbi:MAG: hypothetical protein WCK74_11960 [Gemmatimonadaceae bacterium]